jgi:hypothetical protein
MLKTAKEICNKRVKNYALIPNVTKKQIKKYEKSILPLIQFELAVKEILKTHNISKFFKLQYINFARYIWKVTKNHEGKALKKLINASITAWSVKGLKKNILKEIGKLLINKKSSSTYEKRYTNNYSNNKPR